jgi:ubiquinone/menaquinone biosynthesis C-methylase UbiE
MRRDRLRRGVSRGAVRARADAPHYRGPVGWYEQRVFNPFILDRALDVPQVRAERARALASAGGAILEIGLGTGMNLPLYPASTREITSSGPEAELAPEATRRAAESGLHVAHVQGDARRLPFDRGRFDVVVCTFVLCTVPEPGRAVREIVRVLRPGGRLLFLEHVVAPGGARRLLQRLLAAPMRPVLCGCEVTRDTERTLLENGLAITEIERHEVAAMPWLHRAVIRGIATRG